MSESTPTGEPDSGAAEVLDEIAAAVNGASANGSRPAGPPKLRLGGMALRNGLLIHGPTSWGAAARAKDGSIDVAAGPKPNFGGNKVAKVPALRGPVRLAEAFAVIPIARLAVPSARLPFEDPKVIGAGIAATVLGNLVRGKSERPSAAREGAAAIVGLMPSLVALTGSELAAYHAAEHKAIGGYEEGVDPADMPKEHQRCGSNLIAPMLVTSVAGQVIVDRLIAEPGRVARGVSGLLGVSLSVELFVYAERHPDSAIGRAIHASGHTIQSLFATREPTPEQLEVGVAALDAVLAAEASTASD